MVYSKENYLKNKEIIAIQRREYYLRNKEQIFQKQKEWRKDNEGYKLYRHNYFRKWYYKKKNKKYMVNAMKKYYSKNKDKQISRTCTYKLKHLILNKECRCGETKLLQIHHEIYPTKRAEIIKAIQNGKIYYICSNCHNLLSYINITFPTKEKSN